MKKSSNLWRKCVSLCSQVVKLRDGGICRVPGCNRPATDTIHIIDRDVHITTFDPSNLYAGCRKHHNHDKPLDLIKQHIQVVGQEEVFRLCKLAQEYRRLRESDLIVIRDNLEAELRYLKEIEKEPRVISEQKNKEESCQNRNLNSPGSARTSNRIWSPAF